MFRTLGSFGLGTVAALLLCVSPTQSQAQTPFGISVGFGNGGISYSQGYSPSWYAPRVTRDIYGGSWHGGDWGGGYYGSPYVQPVAPIVIPNSTYWTPGYGHRNHGTILVPHRGHYDPIRY